MIEENRKKALERKRQRDEAFGQQSVNETNGTIYHSAQSAKVEGDGTREVKRVQENPTLKVVNEQREDMGLNFRIEYGDDEDIDIDNDDLADCMGDEDLVSSQFDRKMADGEYYDYN